MESFRRTKSRHFVKLFLWGDIGQFARATLAAADLRGRATRAEFLDPLEQRGAIWRFCQMPLVRKSRSDIDPPTHVIDRLCANGTPSWCSCVFPIGSICDLASQ
jgi:hypothetical protein